MTTAGTRSFLGPIGVRLMLALALVLALPATAAAHGDHPPAETSAPAERAADESGTSPWLIGGVSAGMAGLLGGLIYVKQRQGRPVADGAPAAHATDAEAAREAKRRARSSW